MKTLLSTFISSMLLSSFSFGDVVKDQTDLTVKHKGKVMLVNKFTAKPGQLDKFIEVQTGEYRKLKGQIKGWEGNRLIKELGGKSVINIAVFENLESYNAWRTSKLFADHLEIVKPYILKAEPGMYEMIYDAGNL